MDDFLQEFEATPEEAKSFANPQTTTNNNTSNNSYSNNNNSYNNNKSSGGDWKSKSKDAWKKKQQEVQEPYLPVVVYIDRDFPQDIKDKLINFISMLISKGFTVRFNAEDKDLVNRVTSLSTTNIEAHVPFNDFKGNRDDPEGIKSKFCWNSKTTDHIAQVNFPAWEKLPRIVQIIMSRNVRMLIGSNNNSPAKFLITWSPDGATCTKEVSNETGNVGTYIKVADKLSVPVFNLNNPQSRELISKYILKGESNE